MRLYPIALAAALLPLITIHLCYWWAASNGHVPWCFPYIDSCTSISATGRKAPEYYLFKALMIPSAVFIAAYWWYTCRWLLTLGCQAHRRRGILLTLGFIACAGLILYSVMLGSIGDIYRLQRRIGVTTFFGLTFLAQLLVTYLLGKTPVIVQHFRHWLRALEIMSLVLLATGLICIGISAYDHAYYDSIEDAFEWTFTLLICIHVIISAMLWKKTGFRSQLEIDTTIQ